MGTKKCFSSVSICEDNFAAIFFIILQAKFDKIELDRPINIQTLLCFLQPNDTSLGPRTISETFL